MNTLIYIKNGKLNDEFGTGVTVATREVSPWIKFDTENLGYLPEVITEAEYLQWRDRITNPDLATYFPGVFPGLGVVDKATYDAIQIRRKAEHAKHWSITAAQAQAWLIENEKDDDVEAVIAAALGANGKNAVKRGKRFRAQYNRAETWKYACPLCSELLERAGIDKDKFFAEASRL